MTLREYYNNIKSIDFLPLKEQAVIENKEKLITLNQAQLRMGLTSKNKPIKPRYSDIYLKTKQKMSSYVAEGGTPDLYLKGDFYGEMDVVVENGEYFITSWDWKNGFISERYNNIFGLIPEYKEIAQAAVTKTFLELVRNELSN